MTQLPGYINHQYNVHKRKQWIPQVGCGNTLGWSTDPQRSVDYWNSPQKSTRQCMTAKPHQWVPVGWSVGGLWDWRSTVSPQTHWLLDHHIATSPTQGDQLKLKVKLKVYLYNKHRSVLQLLDFPHSPQTPNLNMSVLIFLPQKETHPAGRSAGSVLIKFLYHL